MQKKLVINWFEQRGFSCEVIKDEGSLVTFKISKGEISVNYLADIYNPDLERILECNIDAFKTLIKMREKEAKKKKRDAKKEAAK